MEQKTIIILVIVIIIYIVLVLIIALFVPLDQSDYYHNEKLGYGAFSYVYKLSEEKTIKRPKHLLGIIGISHEKKILSKIPKCDNVTKYYLIKLIIFRIYTNNDNLLMEYAPKGNLKKYLRKNINEMKPKIFEM